MKKYHFNSQCRVGARVFEPSFDNNVDLIKNEPMLFNYDANDFIQDYHSIYPAPLLTASFLTALRLDNPEFDYRNNQVVIDTRSHMLMPGWLPAIGGFHQDQVPRTRIDKQPNYEDKQNIAKHAMLLVGSCSLTRFAIGEASFNEVPLGEKVYKQWDRDINIYLSSGRLKPFVVPTCHIIYFDHNSFHEAQKATEFGWRYFARATINSNRNPTNEIRRQTQVYVESFRESW